jgi:hypothetical protein
MCQNPDESENFHVLFYAAYYGDNPITKISI